MKVQELSAGDIFYTCWTRTKTILDGTFRLAGSVHLEPHRLLLYKTARVVDRSINYLPGSMECIKVGSIPDESC